VSDRVSHPYKTTGKIMIFYILIFKFLERMREDKRQFKINNVVTSLLMTLSRPISSPTAIRKNLMYMYFVPNSTQYLTTRVIWFIISGEHTDVPLAMTECESTNTP
jgi:hypothetical protein